MNVGRSVGIEALNAYCGVACISVREIFENRGLDLKRYANLSMETRSLGLPIEDPITHAVNAAKPIIDALDEEERASIEVLMTATESGVDYSKSIASYVHRHLGLSRNCRLLEVKAACYASTGALSLAFAYVASGVSPGAKVLVIGTDVALVNARAEYLEPTIGVGAAAILVSDKPKILTLDVGAFGNYSFETMDSARPTADFETADVDGSLFAYLDCFSHSFADYATRVDGADFATTFDHIAMHTPFAGLVKAAHRKMMREIHRAAPAQIEADFARRMQPALAFPQIVGNLCSAAVFLALASILENAPIDGPRRVGLFSYGSGCSSEFWSGVVDQGSAAALRAMRIGERLHARHALGFGEYERLLDDNLQCLVATRDRTIDARRSEAILARVKDRRRMLVLRRIENYHRKYEWI
jgi:polyketide biosynthesis 3-hydroxy-3-methylglutaryl-CoA synthase-like enzyme PksG